VDLNHYYDVHHNLTHERGTYIFNFLSDISMYFYKGSDLNSIIQIKTFIYFVVVCKGFEPLFPPRKGVMS